MAPASGVGATMLRCLVFAAVVTGATAKPASVSVHSRCAWPSKEILYCPVPVQSSAGELCCRAKVHPDTVSLRECTASAKGALVMPFPNLICPFLYIAMGKTWCCVGEYV